MKSPWGFALKPNSTTMAGAFLEENIVSSPCNQWGGGQGQAGEPRE